MGGGDLNLKKSWHPLLIKNQERVWKEEKKALEERKRTQQLLKEQAEERQIQELQRLGGKTEQRVDWLYNAPASGSGQNAEELEAYLLGKKSVEQLFNEQDKKRMEALKQSTAAVGPAAASASSTQYQALGNNANSIRDLAAKIRDDPLLAIKKQEQKAYEELMKNPARLKELREARDARNGHSSEKKSSKHKDRHSSRKHKARYSDDERDYGDDRHKRRRRQDSPDDGPRRSSHRNDYDEPRRNSARRDHSPRRDNPDHDRKRRTSPYEERRTSHHRRSLSPPRRNRISDGPISRAQQPTSAQIPDAAARLAAMSATAAQMHKDRSARVQETQEADRHAEEREAAERRAKLVKGGGKLDASFIKDQSEQAMRAKLAARG